MRARTPQAIHLGRDVARQHDHRDATSFNRSANRDVENTRHLLGVGNGFAVVAALAEQGLGTGLLEVPCPNFSARDL